VAEIAAGQSSSVAEPSYAAETDTLRRLIEHAAHLLPSQGPITVFVHHNTLHALEELPFAAALTRAFQLFGCQPYLSEHRYRQELARGRIRQEDLAAVLQDDLGDRADELVGLLGTRFYLRLAMLQHPLHSAPSAELRWVVAETDALRRFRADVPEDFRKRVIESTRRWIMRDFCNGSAGASGRSYSPAMTAIIAELLESLGKSSIEAWDEATWESFCLQLLWRICCVGVQNARSGAGAPKAGERHRDALLRAAGKDSDELVHDVLIRFSAAFLDQGFAHWTLPHRHEGIWLSFLRLYSQPGGVRPRWLAEQPRELRRLLEDSVSPLESIQESLELLGVEGEEREGFISASLLALRGWAGMIWQMETNAEWAVRPASTGSLIEFLAVRLLLERFAVAHVAREFLAFRGALRDVREAASKRRARNVESGEVQRAFLFLQISQVLGLRPEDLQGLPPRTWARLADEIDAFSALERRRTFHLAYERRYRNQTLDAVVIHSRSRRARRERMGAGDVPAFQMICCIDDREESFRRHLEEVEPCCETFGYAGFFGVAMYYRGVAEAHARPLCPVVIKPRHYVEERPFYTFQESHQRRARTRRIVGAASHYLHRGSRSMTGGALTALFGSLASAPLVGRILFPRAAAQLRRLFGRIVRPPTVTQLLLERTEAEPGPEPGHVGFRADEMADIVERTLRDIGLASRLAPLVIVCGHGSSSLNNPHESAYNCGACSGGRGGPNARAFAQMANDPHVRSILASRGLALPAETYFVGAFHNTCNDSVEYFDLDGLPPMHKKALAGAKRAVDEARRRNAHERCRRFESVALAITPETALAHVEKRAEDLSQARPEYNHATSSVTFVGRRWQTRGLFMDRRAFLASYDPLQDDESGAILAGILSAVAPVCAGISLEYYFSCVDVQGYGCGSKLPHNIVSLLGVMEGAASDLRTGLSAQMTEIHEPVRNLFIIETSPAVIERIMDSHPVIGRLCRNEWVQLATLDPHDSRIHIYRGHRFEPYYPETSDLPQVHSSVDWYRGWRDCLGYAQVREKTAAPVRDAKTSAAMEGHR